MKSKAENPSIGEETRIFFSPDEASVPNFTLTEKFLLNKNVANVYRGYVLKHFGIKILFSKHQIVFNSHRSYVNSFYNFIVSEQDALDYIAKKRHFTFLTCLRDRAV